MSAQSLSGVRNIYCFQFAVAFPTYLVAVSTAFLFVFDMLLGPFLVSPTAPNGAENGPR